MDIFVTIIIPVKNEEKYIIQCINSIYRNKFNLDKLEIIVVDNNSTDNTLMYINKNFCDKKNIKVVTSEAKTIAKVRMDGYSMASGEIIGFLDGDSVVPDNWLSFGLQLLSNSSDISCVGFAVSPPATSATWIEKTWYGMSSGRRWRGRQNVPWLSSFNLLLKKQYFDSVGGFDETLTTCEDADLGNKLGTISTLIFSDEITVIHLGAVTTFKEFFYKEMWRGKSNLLHFLRSKNKKENYKSVFAPLLYIALCATGVFLLFLFIITGKYGICVLSLLIIMICFPFLLALRSNANGFIIIAQTTILYAVYMMARGLAILSINK